MRARVTTFQMQTGKFDEGMEILQSQTLPRLRSQPGCCGVIVVSDPDNGSGQVIALWDSQDAIRAIDEQGFWESQMATVIYLIAAVPERKVYNVDVLDLDPDRLTT